jgi:DNA-damage-inducible protein D
MVLKAIKMKPEIIKELSENLELTVQHTNNIEFWFARDLQVLLGYTEWRNFVQIIEKAKIACTNSGQKTSDHFVDVNKMVDLGYGSKRVIDDVMLTKYAYYLRMPIFIMIK